MDRHKAYHEACGQRHDVIFNTNGSGRVTETWSPCPRVAVAAPVPPVAETLAREPVPSILDGELRAPRAEDTSLAAPHLSWPGKTPVEAPKPKHRYTGHHKPRFSREERDRIHLLVAHILEEGPITTKASVRRRVEREMDIRLSDTAFNLTYLDPALAARAVRAQSAPDPAQAPDASTWVPLVPPAVDRAAEGNFGPSVDPTAMQERFRVGELSLGKDEDGTWQLRATFRTQDESALRELMQFLVGQM